MIGSAFTLIAAASHKIDGIMGIAVAVSFPNDQSSSIFSHWLF